MAALCVFGDGRSIRIWHDPWIDVGNSFWVRSPAPQNTEYFYVSQLINPHTKAWNELLVRQLLNEEEADYVLSIPLSLILEI